MSAINNADFEYIRDLVRRESGMHLEDGKEYLVSRSLLPVCEAVDLATVTDIVAALRTKPLGRLRNAVVDALTVRETSFFRDEHPFDWLRNAILPQVIERRRFERRLNIWCAAASSGQEPYSLAVMLREYFPQTLGWRVRIFATDLVDELVERCREGIYSDYETSRGLPDELRQKYFKRHYRGWQASPVLRKMIECSRLNLIGEWPALPRMDLVLMRNVLIYFDEHVRVGVLSGVAEVLAPDGRLLLGATETIGQLTDRFEAVTERGVLSFTRCKTNAGNARVSRL